MKRRGKISARQLDAILKKVRAKDDKRRARDRARLQTVEQVVKRQKKEIERLKKQIERSEFTNERNVRDATTTEFLRGYEMALKQEAINRVEREKLAVAKRTMKLRDIWKELEALRPFATKDNPFSNQIREWAIRNNLNLSEVWAEYRRKHPRRVYPFSA